MSAHKHYCRQPRPSLVTGSKAGDLGSDDRAPPEARGLSVRLHEDGGVGEEGAGNSNPFSSFLKASEMKELVSNLSGS